MLPAPKRFEKRPGSAYVVGRAATIVARMGAVDDALTRDSRARPARDRLPRIEPMAGTQSAEIAAAAARLVVEEGMEYGAGQAARGARLGLGGRDGELPGNDEVEDEVRDYIALFCADTPAGRAGGAARDRPPLWMERLAEFRPHLTGAVWRGTATRLSATSIELYCDDTKAAEIALIDRRVDYEVSTREPARAASRSTC